MKPRLLDLFSGAGGAAVGYYRAGFDVVGVDIKPMPRYPFEFHQADALEYCAAHGQEFDVIHASPPCQDYSYSYSPYDHGTAWLLPATRDMLIATSKHWVIENVPGAPMRVDYRLCGCMFKLPRLRRQRLFETSWRGFALVPPCNHTEHIITVAGQGIPSHSWYYRRVKKSEYWRMSKLAMGIDWMTHAELTEAIPPAYTKWIGQQLLGWVHF